LSSRRQEIPQSAGIFSNKADKYSIDRKYLIVYISSSGQNIVGMI